MHTAVYDKTAKGREEIATRIYRLAPRLRTLLVMVDGKHAIGDLLSNVAGLGLNETSVTDLLEEGFIAPASVAAPAAPVAPEAAPPVQEAAVAAPAGAADQFQALYIFYNQTIKTTLGLRGFPLQLKVEKAGNVDEMRALRLSFLEAALKARGSAATRLLRDRLDQLLGGRPELDDFFLPEE